MAWDSKTPVSITTSRLLHSSPEAVYQELKDSATNHDDLRVWRDPKIEEALLQRKDPLITLGLAQYGSSDVVSSVLYKRGTSESGDPVYNKALRIAVLSNPLILRRIISGNIFGVLTDEEVLHFINTDKEDEADELYAIVTNPGAKKLLGKLYNQEKPYDRIPPDNFVRATYWSHTNPVLREDESSVDGPDMQAWDVQKGITQIMQKMPLTDNGLRAAYWILRSVGAARVRSVDEDPTPMFQRWQAFNPTNEERSEYQENDAPDLTLKEEFLVMLAAVYGWYSVKNAKGQMEIKYLGTADDPDVLLRCAYYSDERKLTPEQMQKGHQRDGDAFVVAALYNEPLFWNAQTRGELESMMQGRLIYRYKQRCEEIKKKHPQFDMHPASEQGAALLEDEEAPQPTEDQKRLERVEVMLAATSKQLQSVYRVLTWVLILVIAAVVMIWRSHF